MMLALAFGITMVAAAQDTTRTRKTMKNKSDTTTNKTWKNKKDTSNKMWKNKKDSTTKFRRDSL